MKRTHIINERTSTELYASQGLAEKGILGLLVINKSDTGKYTSEGIELSAENVRQLRDFLNECLDSTSSGVQLDGDQLLGQAAKQIFGSLNTGSQEEIDWGESFIAWDDKGK